MNTENYILKMVCLVLLLCGLSTPDAFGQWKINESFESGTLPSSWTTHDINNDGSAFRVFNKPTHAHTGSYICYVDCYDNDGNDWLITPQVAIQAGDVFNFFARSWYGTEDMEVKLSTTGTAVSNFNVTLGSITGLGSTYQEFNYDLSAYAGQNIYLAIHWMQDTYAIIVDDVKVGQPQANDVGVLNIVSPGSFALIDTPVIPTANVKNFGTGEVTVDFPVFCNITDEADNLVHTAQITFTDALAAGATAEVQFTTWTPTIAGTYYLEFYTELAGDADITNDTVNAEFDAVMHYGTGGPDAMGYRWIDSGETDGPVYNWIDISTTGTSAVTYGVDAFAGDDNFSEAIPIGFNFPYYGIARTFFHADINGTLLLADNNWVKPFPDNGWNTDGNVFNYYSTIPGYQGMPALISVFWDDLIATEGTGNVWFQTFGTAPNRYTVIQWNNLEFVAGTGGTPTLCFEVILHENGDVIMQYQNVANGQTGGANPHDFGQSATIGTQNEDCTTGLGYLNEVVTGGNYIGPDPAGNLPGNEMAIKFYPGEDTQPPMITTIKTWNTFNDFAHLQATITDLSGLASDSLYYNYGSGWMAVTHDSINQQNVYHYNIQGLPLGSTVDYYFAATDNSAASNRATLDSLNDEALMFKVLPTADVEVLILSPGNIPGYQDYQNIELPEYTNALDNAGIAYDVYNWAAFDQYIIPEQYEIIFAYSNSTGSTPIHDTLCKALIGFLDSGTQAAPKNLFFASDNLPSAQHAMPDASYLRRFTTAYLRTGFDVQPNPPIYGGSDGLGGPDTPGFHNGSIIGVANSPIGTSNLEIPVLADGPDVIFTRSCLEVYVPDVTNPEISSNTSFLFEDGPVSGEAYSNGKPAAVWLDNIIYKSFFISFDISQFTSDTDVQTTIDEALEWFTPETFVVTVEAIPGDAGLVSGGGTYVVGSTATVTATPGEIYSFVNWTEDGTVVSTDPEYSFTVTADRALIANFEVIMHTVTVAVLPLEGGSVEGAGSYLHGTEATLTATPSPDYIFINWTTGGTVLSTEPELVLLMLSDSSLVAHFESQLIEWELTLSADPETGGTVTGEGIYASGTEVTANAVAAENFRFDDWKENGEVVSTEESYTFNIQANRTLTAHFTDVTATQEVDLKKISISPNPAKDNVTIFNRATGGEAMRAVELYNINGYNMNVQFTILNDSYIMDLADYPAGVYILRITLQSGDIRTFRLVHF